MSILKGMLNGVVKDVKHDFEPEIADAGKAEETLEPILAKLDPKLIANFLQVASGGKINAQEAALGAEAIQSLGGVFKRLKQKIARKL